MISSDDPPAARHRPSAILLVGAALAAALILVSTTRFGVFLVFDVLGDVGSDNLPTAPTEGPVRLDRSISSIATLPLPRRIDQPSGLCRRDGGFVVSTDQAEMFELGPGLDEVLSETRLRGGPLLLRQGKVEAVARLGDDLLIGGELGHLETWHHDAGRWRKSGEIQLPSALLDLELTALAVDQQNGTIFLAADDRVRIHRLDRSGTLLPSLDLRGAAKPGRSLDELLISGLDFADGDLFVISENYATLLRVDPESGDIGEAIGLTDAGEASDVAVADGRAWVTVDHNLFDPRPGVRQFAIE